MKKKTVRYGKSGVRHMGEMGGWAKKNFLALTFFGKIGLKSPTSALSSGGRLRRSVGPAMPG